MTRIQFASPHAPGPRKPDTTVSATPSANTPKEGKLKINKALNLVIPIYDADERAVAYVHSTPIMAETFDSFFLVLAKTFSAIYTEGLGVLAGPRVADKLLKKIAMDMGIWEGEAGVERGLVAEIHRLTNVVTSGPNGWEPMMWYDAKRTGVISAEDAAEVEACLTFFTVVALMHRRSDRTGILESAMKLWGARIESLDFTVFKSSLATSTMADATGKPAAA